MTRRQLPYRGIRLDRKEGIGAGCVTFIKEDISFREIEKGSDQEYIVIAAWIKGVELIIINYYNPCKKLDIGNLTEDGMRGRERTKGKYPGIIDKSESSDSPMDVPFTIGELKRALGTFGATAPGKDNICYEKHLECISYE
ncbi:MAG: hypothetical protein ACRCUS_02345 [Anaerovoracaceae bacterium]